jgi:predicted O-methyltransferase YrrM
MNKLRTSLPPDFEAFVENLLKEVDSVEGYLAPNEIRFLALLAAYPTADGEILEIGSFKGKSTIVLARSLPDNDAHKVHAVDPMIAPSETDPELHGDASSFPDFRQNVIEHGVDGKIEFHQKYSFELAKTWEKPIRLLWIDGDHTYKGTKLDFDGFAGHLEDGAIVAIHDVLHEFDGGIRVFMEDILLSTNFGKCGFVGSIAWAQFHKDDKVGLKFRKEKMKLYRRLSRLIPFVVFNKGLAGFEKKIYKLLRSRVPRGVMKPEKWIELID